MKRKFDIEMGRRMCEEINRILPGKSQRKVAVMLGCNKNAIKAWEDGCTPSAMYLARIHHLGGDVIWILTGERGGNQ